MGEIKTDCDTSNILIRRMILILRSLGFFILVLSFHQTISVDLLKSCKPFSIVRFDIVQMNFTHFPLISLNIYSLRLVLMTLTLYLTTLLTIITKNVIYQIFHLLAHLLRFTNLFYTWWHFWLVRTLSRVQLFTLIDSIFPWSMDRIVNT